MSEKVIKQELREKKLVREFFKNKKNGFFVEVGANEPDPIYSQTSHLENELGWKGILVEPIDYLCLKLKKERINSLVFQVACTSPSKVGKAEFMIPVTAKGDITGSASLQMNVDHSLLQETRTVEVDTVTLDQIIETADVSKIDFLSIDVEGTELDVLKGLSLDRVSPKLIIIEDRLVYLSKHIYLKKKGYNIFRRTGFNNWYSKESPLMNSTLMNQVNLFRKIYLSSWIKRIRETIRMKRLQPLSQL